jgi:predicted nucleic acid-binding protein
VVITAITIAELRYGALRLPDGRRRVSLIAAIDALVAGARDRVLAFDAAAAEVAGRLRAEREAAGKIISTEDTMIAAICLSRGYELATRNVRDFADTSLVLHDPWSL